MHKQLEDIFLKISDFLLLKVLTGSSCHSFMQYDRVFTSYKTVTYAWDPHLLKSDLDLIGSRLFAQIRILMLGPDSDPYPLDIIQVVRIGHISMFLMRNQVINPDPDILKSQIQFHANIMRTATVI
jgi:hypothetical protein